MRVIKPGNKESWKAEIVCSGDLQGRHKACGAKLEIEQSDLRHGDFGSGMDSSSEILFYVVCCECGAWTDVDKVVPRSLQHEILKI